MIHRAALHFIAVSLLLGTIAAVANQPASSDRQIYQDIGKQGAVFDCHDVHCFRVLVAVVLEHLPGPSLFKWKAYAVLTDAAAALAVGRLCLVLGLSGRLAILATWIAATGFGAFQAVFDPYTSDPLMYLLGPAIMADLLEQRVARAGWLGAVGVLAKEFAAAPIWIFTLMATLQRRWGVAVRAALAALTASLVWLALQTYLMTLYNYTYGGNPSVDLLGGGYFAVWVGAIGWPRATAHLFTTFGALYLLLAAGVFRAGPTLRMLALCALPAVLAFVYVQQPDRALCNFQFVVIPMTVIILDPLPAWLCGAFVASFGIANLRLGEPQPAFFLKVRILMLAISLLIALYAVVVDLRRRRLGLLAASSA